MRSFKKTIKIVAICMVLGLSILPPASLMMKTPITQINNFSLLTQIIIESKTLPPPLLIYDDYTFTGNIYQPIVIMADDVVLDGNGYTLKGEKISGAFGVESRAKNVTIKNIIIQTWSYGVYLDSISNNTISGNTIMGTSYGINFEFSSDITVSGNNIMNNGFGIRLYYSSNIILYGNNIDNHIRGIDISGSSYNIILENIIKNNYNYGICLYGSSSNNIIRNNVTDNQYGIFVSDSSNNNLISENNIKENNWLGIWILRSSNNVIYHNNFINNRYQARDSQPAVNDWHHPDLLEGNYWSNYPGADDGSGTEKHSIAGDGIGDTYIPWPGSNFDYYPFIEESGWTPKVCEELENLRQMVLDSSNDAWRNPGVNRKNAMVEKIDVTIAACESEEYVECYDKVLHDIKPKLTGLKIDEEGNPFGNGVFNNPWVIDENLQEDFEEQTDLILGLLKCKT